MTVSIDPREKIVWWAVSDGWMKRIGFTCELNGLKCSAVLMNIESVPFLIISDLNSGFRVYKFPISTVEIIMCETKEATLVLIQEKLEKLAEALMKQEEITVDDIVSKANTKLTEYAKEFGPRPAIEIAEVTDDEL